MDLSVIVPIYNTPIKRLKNCLNSIGKLKNIDYEILLVDDGSQPNINKFCDEFIKKAANVCSYIYKENGGVSSARNIGLEKATGKFILFVDSDDEIFADSYEIKKMESADVIIYDSIIQKGNKRRAYRNALEMDEGNIKCDKLLSAMLQYGKLGFIHAIIYRTSFLRDHNLYFNEKCIQCEDADYNFDVLQKEPKVKYIPDVGYKYYYTAGNAINRWRKKPDLMMFDTAERYNQRLSLINKKLGRGGGK